MRKPCGTGKKFDGSRGLTDSVVSRYGGARECGGVRVGGLSRGQIVKGLWGAVKGLRQRKDLIKSVSSMTEKNANDS